MSLSEVSTPADNTTTAPNPLMSMFNKASKSGAKPAAKRAIVELLDDDDDDDDSSKRLEQQAKRAFASISKPLTEDSFVAWYCANHKNGPANRSSSGGAKSVPAAKKAKPAPLAKGKRTALLKGVATTLKTAVKAKKWHAGDMQTLPGTTVCDASDFGELFPGVNMKSSGGVVTSFSLDEEQIAAAFGALLAKVNVQTWNHPRAFAKSYKTGSTALSFHSADGKYSTGTSVLTLKFNASAGGGGMFGFGGGDGCDY